MGIPAPASLVGPTIGVPPAGDAANFVISGSFAAIGPSQPFACFGPFNVEIWGSVNTTLTTTLATNSATVASATGLAVGQTVSGVNVPRGTTIATIVTTTLTFAFEPGFTAANILGGADAAALFLPAAWTGGVIALERSFDGGATWLTAGVGGMGQGAVYTNALQAASPNSPTGTPAGYVPPVSLVVGEPEKNVIYRLNNLVISTGALVNYRISGTGAAASAWAFTSVL